MIWKFHIFTLENFTDKSPRQRLGGIFTPILRKLFPNLTHKIFQMGGLDGNKPEVQGSSAKAAFAWSSMQAFDSSDSDSVQEKGLVGSTTNQKLMQKKTKSLTARHFC